MATKKHNPGCPCCACIAADGPYAKFENTPTVRIVISGLPASYIFSHFISGFSFEERYDFDIEGMDSANGTFFWPLTKNTQGCLIPLSGYLDSYPTDDNRVLRNYDRPSCNLISSGGDPGVPFIIISGSESAGPIFTLSVNVARGLHFNVRGQIDFTPVTDYTATAGDNTVSIGGTLFSASWPKSSGDIKIIRRAQPEALCNLPLENVDGFVFETIGHISAEIIDL